MQNSKPDSSKEFHAKLSIGSPTSMTDSANNPTTDSPSAVDAINPQHYRSHPSGVECIQVTEHMNFCLGNAVKYLWRAGLKSDSPIEDLQKAKWYIDREIARITSPG